MVGQVGERAACKRAGARHVLRDSRANSEGARYLGDRISAGAGGRRPSLGLGERHGTAAVRAAARSRGTRRIHRAISRAPAPSLSPPARWKDTVPVKAIVRGGEARSEE